jgi:hypothetical protein
VVISRYDPRKLPVVIDIPAEPDFIQMRKPPSRTRYWWRVFWVCAGISIVYLTLHRHRAAEQLVALPGWDELLPCSYVASFDGTKKLGFSENGSAVLYDNSAKSGSVDGNWTFDETAKLYTVTINGEIATYSVIEPGGGGICILVKGNANAADLRSSWFSSPIDDDHSDDREPDSGL